MDVAFSQIWQLAQPNNSFPSWGSEAPWVGAGRLLQIGSQITLDIIAPFQ